MFSLFQRPTHNIPLSKSFRLRARTIAFGCPSEIHSFAGSPPHGPNSTLFPSVTLDRYIATAARAVFLHSICLSSILNSSWTLTRAWRFGSVCVGDIAANDPTGASVTRGGCVATENRSLIADPWRGPERGRCLSERIDVRDWPIVDKFIEIDPTSLRTPDLERNQAEPTWR